MISRGSPPCQVTRPDSKGDQLGLVMLDEPTAKQSDPTVLDLQLRTLTKQPTVKPVVSPSPPPPPPSGSAASLECLLGGTVAPLYCGHLGDLVKCPV